VQLHNKEKGETQTIEEMSLHNKESGTAPHEL